jgi:hypothetical protein
MRNPRQRHRRLYLQPIQLLDPRLGPEQRAGRRPGRHACKGAAGERAQAILQSEHAAGGEDAPLVEIALRDLPKRQSLDDLGAIVSRVLGFSLSDT